MASFGGRCSHYHDEDYKDYKDYEDYEDYDEDYEDVDDDDDSDGFIWRCLIPEIKD